MRRRKDRTAAIANPSPSKKSKSSPEANIEKTKRPSRGRRRKQSTSSDNDSTEETTSRKQTSDVVEVTTQPPVKEESPEEKQDQVWQVKTADGSVDTGEIQKLKICLTRPSSTPERIDRSPRVKRKHARATSSSDTPSVEGVEERKKSTRHRSKRLTRESKDESEKNDSPEDEPDVESETKKVETVEKVSQSSGSTEIVTNEEDKSITTTAKDDVVDSVQESLDKKPNDESECEKSSDADTTVTQITVQEDHSEQEEQSEQITPDKDISNQEKHIEEAEIKQVHNEESDAHNTIVDSPKKGIESQDGQDAEPQVKVSTCEDKTEDSVSNQQERSPANDSKALNENDFVVSSEKAEKEISRQISTDSVKDDEKRERKNSSVQEHSDSVHEDTVHNGQAAPILINRKRRWGARANKLTTQKSITISTDVLKEIIPDVKPVEFEEVIDEKKSHRRIEIVESDGPVLPKIVIDNTNNAEQNNIGSKDNGTRETNLGSNRKISIVKDNESIIARPPSPPRHKQSCILYVTNLVRPFTLLQLKNLLQRTGKIVDDGFWIDRIKSKCYVKYETEDHAVETRHALHGVTWPVSNPKTLQVDFATEEAFVKAKTNEDADSAPTSTIPGTVEDWLREQDIKRERGELEKPWERKASVREWDMGKGDKDKEKLKKDERPMDRRRHRSMERSPEPAKKFKKKEEEAPAKLLDDLFKKTKVTPCIYWLPLSAETIAIKEEQRRLHMAEHERRLHELRRGNRRH